MCEGATHLLVPLVGIHTLVTRLIDGYSKSASDINAVFLEENVETTFTIIERSFNGRNHLNPKHLTIIEGKGNKLWHAIKATMR